MASSYTVIGLLLFLTPISLIPSPSNALSPIDQVCPKTKNPPFCYHALNSDPNAPSATEIIGLGIPVINCAQSTPQPTRQVLKDLISITNDPYYLDRYSSCLSLLDQIETYLEGSRYAFVGGSYGNMANWGNIVTNHMKWYCDDLFENGLEPDRLKQHSKDVQDSADMVTVVGDMLNHPS